MHKKGVLATPLFIICSAIPKPESIKNNYFLDNRETLFGVQTFLRSAQKTDY